MFPGGNRFWRDSLATIVPVRPAQGLTGAIPSHRQFDFNLASLRRRRTLRPQHFPIDLDSLGRSRCQLVGGTDGHQNRRKFGHVTTESSRATLHHQNTCGSCLISLNTSLPKNRAVRARSNMVSKPAGHDGDAPMGTSENAMVADVRTSRQPASSIFRRFPSRLHSI